MKRILILILLLPGVLLFAACSKKTARVDPSQPAQTATEQKEAVTAKAEETTQAAGMAGDKIDGRELNSEDVRKTDIAKQAGKDGFELRDIYFDFDSYDIRPESKNQLQETASYLLKNKTSKVSVEGHCDERGTDEYNLALGDRRANTVKKFLAALGVGGDRIRAITYGEEKPVCVDQNEECRQKNRRAHFGLTE